jgi:site-specific recombinase XerD
MGQTIGTDLDLINRWIRGYAPNTARNYMRDIMLFYSHFGRPLQDISFDEIKRYVVETNAPSEAVRRRLLHAIKSLYRTAVALNYLAVDPAAAVQNVEREPDPGPPLTLTEAEVTALMQSAERA